MYQTREEWLNAAIGEMRYLFANNGATVPSNIKVSCGFPFGRRGITSLDAIGQAWPAALSAGDQIELFISPVLDDVERVADVLAHELVHAAVGNDKGHGPVFKALAESIGLTGKMTATVGGNVFKAWFASVQERLGPYPHAKLHVHIMRRTPQGKPDAGPAPRDPGTEQPPKGGITYTPQSTRLVKVYCAQCAADNTPYIVRMSRKTMERGLPICPIHTASMQADDSTEGV